MTIPDKRTSLSKKTFRKNIKKKTYWAAVKTFSLAKSVATGNSKLFLARQEVNHNFRIIDPSNPVLLR